MIIFPKAKINLGLHITGKRSDGYHNIESLFYPVSLSDALEYVISDENQEEDIFTVTGLNTGCSPEDNLIIKALRKLRENYTIPPLKIHLHKVIPVGAGLGGGSSDAACFLKSVNKCFGLNIDKSALNAIAMEIGSDCPFFIEYVPAYATGRGEILTPIRPILSGYYILILNPGIMINTGEAYGNSRPQIPVSNLSHLEDSPVEEWNKIIINDFEDFVFKKHPLVKEIKDGLYSSGALISSMSGSGSSVFGIFKKKPELPDKMIDFVIYKGLL
jgi:4-diphosphocytidyl-2-C-methyl-D-erythritol kinase